MLRSNFENSQEYDKVIVSTGNHMLWVQGKITKVNSRYVYVKFENEYGRELHYKYLTRSGECAEQYSSYSEYIYQWDKAEFDSHNSYIIDQRKRGDYINLIMAKNLNYLSTDKLKRICDIINEEECEKV